MPAAAWVALLGGALVLTASVVVMTNNWDALGRSVRLAALTAGVAAVLWASERLRQIVPTTAGIVAHVGTFLTVPFGIAAVSLFGGTWPYCLVVGGVAGASAHRVSGGTLESRHDARRSDRRGGDRFDRSRGNNVHQRRTGRCARRTRVRAGGRVPACNGAGVAGRPVTALGHGGSCRRGCRRPHGRRPVRRPAHLVGAPGRDDRSRRVWHRCDTFEPTKPLVAVDRFDSVRRDHRGHRGRQHDNSRSDDSGSTPSLRRARCVVSRPTLAASRRTNRECVRRVRVVLHLDGGVRAERVSRR